jgi:hypothetical protein
MSKPPRPSVLALLAASPEMGRLVDEIARDSDMNSIVECELSPPQRDPKRAICPACRRRKVEVYTQRIGKIRRSHQRVKGTSVRPISVYGGSTTS